MSFRPIYALSCVMLLAPVATGCNAPAAPPQVPGATPHPHWSYPDEGAQRWGDLDPAFFVCKRGVAQSPIELPLSPARHEHAPVRPRWDPVPLRITSNRHTVQVEDTAPSALVLDGTTYKLAQFHFHSPSDHVIAGHRFAVEMHLVHKSDTGKLLAMAIFFESGAENATLAPMWHAIPTEPDGPPVIVPGATVDIAALLPSAPRYLRYEGSLTVPPCTEGVTWLIVEPDASSQMSPEQIKTLHDRTQPNTSRALQPAGGREVIELLP
jgi:carbonic anhydrase